MTNWKNIHQDFTPELQQQWENNNFTYEQTKEWIDIGLKPQDTNYAVWLRNIKRVDSDWVLNHGSNENLREEYRKYGEYGQPEWESFCKWLRQEIILLDGSKAKIKPEKQNNYGQISTETLTSFYESLKATLENKSDCYLFPSLSQSGEFEELFPPANCRFGKKTNQQTLTAEDYALLARLFDSWKEVLGIHKKRGKSNSEFVKHLKTLYEGSSVYFDIQEKSVVIKNQRTKEQYEEEIKYADEFKKIRIRYQELITAGETDLPEPPAIVDDIYEDGVYQLEGDDRFQRLITKLDEWETSQNKKLEKVSSLIEFLKWVSSEEEKLAKENYAEEARKNFMALIDRFHEEREKYEALNEEEKELYHKEQELLSQLAEKEALLAKCQSKIEELNALPSLKDQEKEDLSNWTILANHTEKYEIELINLKLEALGFKKEEARLAKEIDRLSVAEAKKGTKNILLVGRTGGGKSTLANVLVNKNGNFEEVFKESAGSISETKSIQTEKFAVDISRDGTQQIHYLVIDTAGFGDTQLSEKEILQLLKELVPIIKENGINQIFLVNNGRFKKEEIDIYRILEEVLFDKNAANYTTIVRTKFPNFENHEACEADKQQLSAENDEIARILQTSKIIYIDNPPLEGRTGVIEVNKETRELSRKRLITYLGTCLDNYKSSNLEELGERVDNFMTQEEALNKEIADKEQKIKEREAELKKEVQIIEEQKARDLRITGRNFERQAQELQAQSEKKIQTTRQELEEVHQSQLRESQQAYNQNLNQISSSYQSNLSQIRNSLNHVRVGEPVCRYGHDNNIRTYNKNGLLISDYQSDFIGHIYCPTCGQNQTDYTLRNATTYTLEEWSRREAQQAAERTRRMEEAIREQEQQRQNMVSQIMQLRNSREAAFQQALDQQRSYQENLLSEQRANEASILSQRREELEGIINATSSSRETDLRNQSNQQIQDWQAQVGQAEQRRSVLWQGFGNSLFGGAGFRSFFGGEQ